MSRSDYAHWNEEADRIWWEEEGKHEDFNEAEWEPSEEVSAMDDFCESVADMENESIVKMLCDADYRRRWPKAVVILSDEWDTRVLNNEAAIREVEEMIAEAHVVWMWENDGDPED